MIIGIGVDLVAVDRIARVVGRRGERFLSRVFTPAELAACPPGEQYARRLAARFAAKEAVLKALGTGLAAGIRWREIEVQRPARGRPAITLHGRAAQHAAALGVARLHLSLSHDGPFAAAFVVAEGGRP
ncbi:MAG TPA: holo-ACP synthase [Bacillota bacterium]